MHNKRKKVLFFIQDGVGGAERMSVLIGKGLDKNLFDVRFYLIERHVRTTIADFIPDSFPIVKVANPNPLRLMWNMVRTILQEKPDVLFCSVMYLSTKFMLWRWFFPKVKVILRCENYIYTFTKKQQSFIKFTYHKADCIIAQTEEMKDELVEQLHFKSDKIVVLHNPIDKETIDKKTRTVGNPYPDNGMRKFVASGRFSYQKGFDILTQAFCLIHKEQPDTELYIIGDKDIDGGTIYSEVMKIAKQNECDTYIHCIGYQSNPYKYIKYADCFVLSSRWEGLPNVLTEALYLNTPTAATTCIPIISRIIKDCVTGFLAEPENPKKLADAMKKALRLGRIESTYTSADIADFQHLFC